MKTQLRLSTVVLAVLCGLQAVAQETSSDHLRDVSRDVRFPLGQLEKANKILGAEIKDNGGQRLGTVKDLVIDLHNGRIVEVILGVGGVLGVDEHLTAAPPGQFTCEAGAKTVRMDTEELQLQHAPAFKFSQWDENVQPSAVAEVYQYYNAKPYFAVESPSSLPAHNHTLAIIRLGEVQRASKLIGSGIRDTSNDKIGKVENLVVDLSAGRVVEAIVASGGFLGMDQELSAIPPQSLNPGLQRNEFVLDTTRDALARAPHFKATDWTNVNDAPQIGLVYRTYKVEPYFGTNAADNTAQNVRDRSDSTLTPLNQGTSNADVKTTRQIRQEVIALPGLSVNGQNVKIITLDGRVTLRGPVASEDEKRQIAEIAAKVASPANVDDQLQVENQSSPNSAK